jgi:hypothetical protein
MISAPTLPLLLIKMGVPVQSFPSWLRAPQGVEAHQSATNAEMQERTTSAVLFGLTLAGEDSLSILSQYARVVGQFSPAFLRGLADSDWAMVWFSGSRVLLVHMEHRWLLELMAFRSDDDPGRVTPKVHGRAELYFPVPSYAHPEIEKISSRLTTPRVRRKAEVCVLVRTQHGLAFAEVNIKPSRVPDLDTFYGKGFTKDFHEPLLTRLQNERGGLAFLHGPPGGGKTTYVRHLAGLLGSKKRLLIVQRALIAAMGEPDFIDLLMRMERRPTVLLVEDAEDVVSIDGRSLSAATGTLLNLSDGLLNDISGVQAIVTFNCPVDKIDPALVRAGRNLGMHEFRALTVPEAQKLATAMGRPIDHLTGPGPFMLADVLAVPPIGPPLTPRKGRYF